MKEDRGKDTLLRWGKYERAQFDEYILNTDAGRREGRQVGVGKIPVHRQTENWRCLGAQSGVCREIGQCYACFPLEPSVFQLLLHFQRVPGWGSVYVGDVDISFYSAFTPQAKSHSFCKIKLDCVLFILCVWTDATGRTCRGQRTLVALGSCLSPCGFGE